MLASSYKKSSAYVQLSKNPLSKKHGWHFSFPKIAPSPYAFQKARVVMGASNLSIVNLKLGIANIERGSLPPFVLP
jgi:hypothetical protein